MRRTGTVQMFIVSKKEPAEIKILHLSIVHVKTLKYIRLAPSNSPITYEFLIKSLIYKYVLVFVYNVVRYLSVNSFRMSQHLYILAPCLDH